MDTFEVRCLLSEEETLWVGTDRGLFRLGDSGLESVALPPRFAERPIAAVHRAANGALWVGTTNDGLARLVGGVFVPEPATGEDRVPGLLRIAEDSEGRLLLWSARQGIFRLVGHTLEQLPAAESAQARAFFLPRGHPSDPARLAPWLARLPGVPDAAGHSRFAVAASADGSVWLGTAEGLFREASGGIAPVPLGRHRTEVRTLLQDRDGALWVGTDGDGLYQLVPRLFHAVTREDGLAGASVHGLSGDLRGALYATLACHGMVRLDAATGRVERAWSASELGGCPWTVLPARDGGLFVGFFSGPLARIGADGGVRSDGPEVESGTALYRDRRGAIWVGTREHGAFRFEEGDGAEVVAIEGLPGRTVLAFAEDGAGRVWIATERGAAIWEDGSIRDLSTKGSAGTPRTPGSGGTHGLPAIPIRAFLPDGPRMWVGTFGGGLAVQTEDGSFALLDARRGLFENVVSWIHAEGDWIWWTGNRGVYRARRAHLLRAAEDPAGMLHPQRFTRSDGMPSDETNGGAWPAGWKDERGRLWIPTVDGLTFVDPLALVSVRGAPCVRIDQVLVDGHDVPVPETQAIELQPGVRHLDIVVTAPELGQPERVRFATRLDGLDHSWHDMGPLRRIGYSSLRPGEYVFRAAAAMHGGGLLGEEARLVIRQRAGLAESWPAKILAGLSVLALGGALAWARASISRRRADRARAAEARREADRREEERRYQQRLVLLQRDLHDGIGSIVANIGLLAALGERSAPRAAGGPLHNIAMLAQEGASEVRGLMNAVEAREMDWDDIIAETRRQGLMLLEGHGIELSLDRKGEPEDPRVDVPTGLSLLRIVREALHNVVKHAGARTAGVRFEFSTSRLRLSIADDGRGPSAKPGAGRGLPNMSQRVRDLGGMIDFERGPGFRIRIEIPLGAERRRAAHPR